MTGSNTDFERFTLAMLVVLAACVVSLLALPNVKVTDVESPGVTLSNLKDIGLAVELYKGDYDERFPLEMSSSFAAYECLKEYQSSTGPIESLNPNSPAILGNGSLAGKKHESIVDPDGTLMFFDSAPWPTGRRSVVTVGVKAARLSEKEFQAAVNHLFVRPNPSGPPN